MDDSGFLAIVAREAGISREAAQRAVEATLRTLAERISGGEARDIADELPTGLRPLLQDGENAENWHLDEFIRRIALREGVTEAEAEAHARAVFAAMGMAVSRGEIADLASELPKDFLPLLTEAQRPLEPRDALHAKRSAGQAPDDEPSTAEIVERVARRAGLEDDDARRALDAVLETLAERISSGEVEDIERELPPDLRPALRRGDELSNGAARPLSLQEFERRIAQREGTTPKQAREHARAVFATLREVVSEKELSDVEAQLPDEYAALLARA